MKKVAVALTMATLVAVPLANAAMPLELPTLTRIASRLSGLTQKTKVRVLTVGAAAMQRQAQVVLDRDYPRDQQAYDETVYRALGLLGQGESLRPALLAEATKGVRGLYDPVSGTLYVRSGSGKRPALVHELVHALQDQAFDLRRLSALRRGSRDAALAGAAAVEGDAQLSTTMLGGGRTPSAVRHSVATSPAGLVDQFLALEHEFPYATGLRFATTLHNLGGKSAVFSSLRTFPTTTEQIFHIDAFLAREAAAPVPLPQTVSGFTLERSDTWGELDVRALLAIAQVPRLDQVGDGWGGGRSAVYRDGSGAASVALALSWDSDLDAAQWAEAVSTWLNEIFDADTPGFPATTSCAVEACWDVAGRSIAFARRGERTALVVGSKVAGAAALAGAIIAAG